jgi:hypothetical protein
VPQYEVVTVNVAGIAILAIDRVKYDQKTG